MQEPPFPLPHEGPAMPNVYSDYEFDPDFPGTMKPGNRLENRELSTVLEEWEDRPNPNCMQLPQDMLIHVPLKPPEEILTWLDRRGLLDTEEDEDVVPARDVGLIDEEFDLEDDPELSEGEFSVSDSAIIESTEQGATMSDFL